MGYGKHYLLVPKSQRERFAGCADRFDAIGHKGAVALGFENSLFARPQAGKRFPFAQARQGKFPIRTNTLRKTVVALKGGKAGYFGNVHTDAMVAKRRRNDFVAVT